MRGEVKRKRMIERSDKILWHQQIRQPRVSTEKGNVWSLKNVVRVIKKRGQVVKMTAQLYTR